MYSNEIEGLVDFLQSDLGKPILRIYRGEMPLEELVCMTSEEKCIAIMLRRLKVVLDGELK